MSEHDLFEIMRTTRSMRRLKPDKVPEALIREVLEAGVCAANGGNLQFWRFLVIEDPAVKQNVGAYYRRAWHEQAAPRYRTGAPPSSVDQARFQRMLAAAEYLADHIHEAPVWIVPCLMPPSEVVGTRVTPKEVFRRISGSNIYPAVQNMLLAARALGLGATLTTLHLLFEEESEAALGLPPDAHSYAILPIGYPLGRFGPVARAPLEEVVYRDRWGQRWSMPTLPRT